MKYWLFEDEALHGPFSPEELRQRPRFERGTLVHPEERFDPAEERWIQAGDIPQLALVLAALERGTHEGRFITPEPTVRDLPVLGAILEQTEKFEEALVSLRAQLRSGEDGLDGLRADGRAREAKTDALSAATAALDARFRDFLAQAGVLQRAAEGLDAERASLSQGLAETRREAESARIEAAAFKESVAAELAALQAGTSTLRKDLATAAAERSALSARLKSAEDGAARLKDELTAAADSESRRWLLGMVRISPRRLAALLILLLISTALAAVYSAPRNSDSMLRWIMGLKTGSIIHGNKTEVPHRRVQGGGRAGGVEGRQDGSAAGGALRGRPTANPEAPKY